jgi:hypothetical protein
VVSSAAASATCFVRANQRTDPVDATPNPSCTIGLILSRNAATQTTAISDPSVAPIARMDRSRR